MRLRDKLPERMVDPMGAPNDWLLRRLRAAEDLDARRRLRALERRAGNGWEPSEEELDEDDELDPEDLMPGRKYRKKGGAGKKDQFVTTMQLPNDELAIVPLERSYSFVSITVYAASTVGVNNEWTNMPAAATHLFGNVGRYWNHVDLSPFAEVRIVTWMDTAAFAGAILNPNYYDGGVPAYFDLAASALAASVTVDTLGLRVGPWAEIASGALALGDVEIAVVGAGGNGTADPRFGNIAIQFR